MFYFDLDLPLRPVDTKFSYKVLSIHFELNYSSTKFYSMLGRFDYEKKRIIDKRKNKYKIIRTYAISKLGEYVIL